MTESRADAATPGGLLQLQAALQAHLLAPEAAPTPALRAALVDGPGPDLARRLQIYHRAYRARLQDTLADTFGHTAAYLGEARFAELAQAYIADHPSRWRSLRWYGADFPDWLAQHQPQRGELAELARLDQALRHCFDSADAPVLTAADLAALPPAAWATLGWRLQPGTALLHMHCNALSIWQALDADSQPPPPMPLPAPGLLLVWRRDLQPHFRSVDPLEALALQRTLVGDSFADTCAALIAAHRPGDPQPDATASAGTLLRRWLDDGLLAGWTGWPH